MAKANVNFNNFIKWYYGRDNVAECVQMAADDLDIDLHEYIDTDVELQVTEIVDGCLYECVINGKTALDAINNYFEQVF